MDIGVWITLGGALLFRLCECIVKVGKWDPIAIIKEFFKIS